MRCAVLTLDSAEDNFNSIQYNNSICPLGIPKESGHAPSCARVGCHGVGEKLCAAGFLLGEDGYSREAVT